MGQFSPCTTTRAERQAGFRHKALGTQHDARQGIAMALGSKAQHASFCTAALLAISLAASGCGAASPRAVGHIGSQPSQTATDRAVISQCLAFLRASGISTSGDNPATMSVGYGMDGSTMVFSDEASTNELCNESSSGQFVVGNGVDFPAPHGASNQPPASSGGPDTLPPGTLASAPTVMPGQEYSGNTATSVTDSLGNHREFYKFSVTAGDQVTVDWQTASSSENVYFSDCPVGLSDSTWTTTTCDWFGDGDSNGSGTATWTAPTSGVQVLQFKTDTHGTPGPFTLTVQSVGAGSGTATSGLPAGATICDKDIPDVASPDGIIGDPSKTTCDFVRDVREAYTQAYPWGSTQTFTVTRAPSTGDHTHYKMTCGSYQNQPTNAGSPGWIECRGGNGADLFFGWHV